MGKRGRALLAGIAALLGLAAAAPAAAEVKLLDHRYLVVLQGNSEAAKGLVVANGGVVVHDMSRQIGVLIVESSNPAFAAALRSSPLVEEVGNDFATKSVPARSEASFTTASHPGGNGVGGGPQGPHADALEPLQWSMQQVRAPQAHAIQAGSRAVEVAVIDSGIDGDHEDFVGAGGSNVDCARGRDFVPLGPTVGDPNPCHDNNFHGTHVAGIIGARVNGIGVVGVAPNVTLIPIKACDPTGFCYSSSTVAAETYAGDIKAEVMNMSYFVDDNELLESTMFKCNNDPVQRAFRKANERAIQYARQQGVTPVAALGNADFDLAHPPEPYENNCEVVPAETQGVIGTMSTGPQQEKSVFSNYGVGATDVAAPGGNPDEEVPFLCTHEVLSTIPNEFGISWFCLSGTSMASPHAAGVAALIISQYGRIKDGDVWMPPQQVEAYLQGTVVDIGKKGYDECFGHGRVDALRAVQHQTRAEYQANPPCPEYEE